MGIQLPEDTVFTPDAAARHGSTGLGLIGASRGVHSLLSRRTQRLFVVGACGAPSSRILLGRYCKPPPPLRVGRSAPSPYPSPCRRVGCALNPRRLACRLRSGDACGGGAGPSARRPQPAGNRKRNAPAAWAQPVHRLTAVRTSGTQGSTQYTRCGERLKQGSCDHHSHQRHNVAAMQKVLEYSPDAQALLTALCAAVPQLVQVLLAVVRHTGQVSCVSYETLAPLRSASLLGIHVVRRLPSPACVDGQRAR
jgi:hypothetical protein